MKPLPSPWPLDGIKAFSGTEAQSQIIRTSQIETYLSVGHHEDKFFLVGSKGLGKTTLLSYKSFLYHDQLGGSFRFNSSIDELTEKLEIQSKTFSMDELFGFRSISDWETLWKLTLWILAFKIYDLPINPELDKMIRKSSRLATIFSELLAQRKKISTFPQYINEFIDRANLIQHGVAIFIDDVDQAFESCFFNNEHYSEYYDGDSDRPVVDIWINGQIALIAAIYSIHRQNRHIKIFATIRTEAYHCIKTQMKANYEHHTILLKYDKLDIRDIFIKNIQLIPNEQIAFRAGKTPIEQFLGFDAEVNHRFAVDYKNDPRTESAFDFIFRHTYGRPREIVQMGNELHGLVTRSSYRNMPRHEKIETVRKLATQFANELLVQYWKQIIPGFDQDAFMAFLRSVPGNAITKEEFDRLDPNATRLYYSLGLLGHIEEDPHGIKTQRFLPAAEYNYTNLFTIPNSSYYIIHPTVDQMLFHYHTYGDFYYKYCVIGNGYVFHPPQEDGPKQAEYYIPKELSGHDGRSPTDGHACGIREYYEYFFGGENKLRFHRAYLHEISAAKRILTKLARICYYHRLNKAFPGKPYTESIKILVRELQDFSLARPYNNIMNEDKMVDSHAKFLDKLFGRIIVLGAILFVDLPFSSTKRLLQTGQIDLKAEDDAETVYQYLRRSFFIPHLSRSITSLSSDFKIPKRRGVKQAIFDASSDFERFTLLELRKTVNDEVDMLSDSPKLFDKSEHAEWVQTNVMDKIWSPFM